MRAPVKRALRGTGPEVKVKKRVVHPNLIARRVGSRSRPIPGFF